MRRRCAARLRGYLYKSREQLRTARADLQPALTALLDTMHRQLRTAQFHAHLFDRRCLTEAGRCLCDPSGEFGCQGAYNADRCSYRQHRANPYTSRESRIEFSTWNLDHRIERSRCVLPALVSAVQSAGQRQVNWHYFYRLLFTTDNLRLVHVVCHDKSSHDQFTCDPRQFYLARPRPARRPRTGSPTSPARQRPRRRCCRH